MVVLVHGIYLDSFMLNSYLDSWSWHLKITNHKRQGIPVGFITENMAKIGSVYCLKTWRCALGLPTTQG
jgi:hypothetical protein